MPNALASQSSPYLLQHAHNPVAWRPWNPATLAEARERGLPIFLSIGYSTCYWCHVMERESFEHEPTAAYLNEHFTPIKLDREERPDLDDLYMAATVTFTGRGGWPMSVFLEPDTLRPFFCGTYYPLEPRHGLPSFRQVLQGMHEAWTKQRDDIREQGGKLAEAVAEQIGADAEPAPLGRVQLDQALRVLLNQFDAANGGFGGAEQGPKFPQPVFCEFLLDVRDDADEATRAAIDAALRTTLDAMSFGGLHDHLGGGFHRYAVDATWIVPHFEKMLYDNAQLLDLYARAVTVFDSTWYARTARRTAEYLLREMSAGTQGQSGGGGGGGFYSAQDAEVDSREGLSFLWNQEQIREVLDSADADFAIAAFALDRGTNFQDPHHPDDPPANVLRLAAPPESLARTLGVSTDEFIERLDRVCDALRQARDQRTQPGTDDKILTSWNGLAIGALARASTLLDEPRYAEAARHAARFLLTHHRSPDGTLLRTSREGGPAHTPAFLEDHAALAGACLALHDLEPGETEFLTAARNLLDEAFRAFTSENSGEGLFDARPDQGDLFVNPRSTHDGASPSAQSQTLHALLDLADRTGDSAEIERCASHLNALSPAIAANPYSTLHAVRAFRRILKNKPVFAPHVQFFEDIAPADQPAPQSRPAPAIPVEVYASAERVTVTDDEPAQFQLVLRIKPGHHVVAADPGPDAPTGLVPLRVGLVSGQGVAVYADYPAGTPHGVESVGPVNVYEADSDEYGHEFTVALEKADGVGASPGHPVLGITLQACTETECLPPITLELDVAVDLH